MVYRLLRKQNTGSRSYLRYRKEKNLLIPSILLYLALPATTVTAACVVGAPRRTQQPAAQTKSTTGESFYYGSFF